MPPSLAWTAEVGSCVVVVGWSGLLRSPTLLAEVCVPPVCIASMH